jgi:hypothetical protein
MARGNDVERRTYLLNRFRALSARFALALILAAGWLILRIVFFSEPHYRAVNLNGPDITGASLQALPEKAHITSLVLGKTAVRDEDLAHLEPMTNLSSLHITGPCQITDDGLSHLRHLTNLGILSLQFTGIKGDGLHYLAELPRLQILDLNATQVTDDKLRQLESLQHIKVIELELTGVTEAGVAKLRAALPGVRIDFNQGAEAVGRSRHKPAELKAAKE